MRYTIACKTSVGRVRTSNEDAALVHPSGWIALADGMGGAPAGEVASAIAVTVARTEFSAGAPIQRVAESAHRAVELAARLQPMWRKMGCTLVALKFEGSVYALAHVGDSRAYLLRDGKLARLTKDHAQGHMLLRAIGHEGARPDVKRGAIRAGDTFLVCSDGLSNMLPDAVIRQILMRRGEPGAVCKALVDAANEAGGVDNVTVAVARIR